MPKAKTENLRSRPYLLTIPAGVPFLDCLAEALLDGGLLPGLKPLRGEPFALADTLIFLPTRRAGRELSEILARRLGGAAVLPRILALGTFDEDEDAFAEEGDGADTVGETERRLVLARLIRQWAESVGGAISGDETELIPTSPGEAMSLAITLGQLIDSFETEQIAWDKLAGLVPRQHDEIWRLTADFLNIAAQFWPEYLKQGKLVGAAAKRNAQLRALADMLRANPPASPVIVAGSTGSNPATAELMRAVAHLPNGGVVLHGLDVRANAETWRAIGGGGGEAQSWTHPQHAFHRLLARLGVQPGEVGIVGREDRERDRRRALISQALLPSDLTDRWQSLSIDAAAALDGVTLIEAANEREEALAIALALREALEQPDKTAALITPDRALARRVAAELKRWGIDAEDSAGLPLADSRAGILARLVVEAAAQQLAPQTLIALLRHPDARFGLAPDDMRRAVNALEIGVLRGPAPPPGVEGLLRKFEIERTAPEDERRFWHPAKRGLRDEEWNAARDLIARLNETLEPICGLGQGGFEAPLAELLRAHRDAFTAARKDARADADADALAAFFEETSGPLANAMGVRLADYPALFKTMLRGKTARAQRPAHPRLKILGTLEARLLGFDRTVLGGLNEGTWPKQAENDPFLSRPMRGALGLPPPEWRTGQSAHDFEQALGGRDVVLTRALKAGGAPSVAARWLQRLEAVSGDEWAKVRARGEVYRIFADSLDAPSGAPPRLERPEPKPPRDLRPKRLSVTEIETLIRDPYAIYARHVLRLVPMEDAGALPQASDRGNIIHAALAEFSANEDVFADDAEAKLIAHGRAAFSPYWDFPDVRALWWPRFEKIARWFILWERARKPKILRSYTETRGSMSWTTSEGRPFTLAGRADRFDATAKGYAVIDYKTGAPPGDSEVRAGFAPQLPLEAAMLAEGAFEGVEKGEASDLLYVRLSGLNEGGQEKIIRTGDFTAHTLGQEKLARLKALIDTYENEHNPYLSQTRPKFLRRAAGDYDHLARYAEWSLAPEPEPDETADDA